MIQGDSAIPGSRARGANTSPIARDCDPPIDDKKGLPTVQLLSETAKQVRRKERKVTEKPDTTRLLKQQEDQKGIRGERGSDSVTLLGKRAITRGERGWMLTMNTHGIEYSIAGYVEKIFRDPKSHAFFFTFSLFFIMCSVLINYWEQRLRAALAMVKKKSHPLFFSTVAPGKEQSTQVSQVWDQPNTSHAK